MNIVVTGCAGFIGVNFSTYLIDRYPADRVIGIDSLTYAANLDALAELSAREGFCFYKADICDEAAIEAIFALEKPDIVVNFAAESHVDRSLSNPDIFMRTNVQGTAVLLDAAARHGVQHFHQISTDEVYGDMPLDSTDKFTESSPLNPTSPYSLSKARADMIVLSYGDRLGIDVSISRSTNNFGPYQHIEKLIPMSIDRLLSHLPVPIYGDGSNMRDWLYVLDHCAAVDLIIRAGKCGIYNVGASNEWANIDLIKKIITLIGIPNAEMIFVEDRKNHDRRYPVSCEKIKVELGWAPEADFESMLKYTVEWYRGRR